MKTGVLDEVVDIEKTDKHSFTHFALCNGNQIRYLVKPKGKKRLSQNISSYSGKLGLLMKVLPITPFALLSVGHLGYYVKCELKPEVKDVLNRLDKKSWNMIVGTYGPQQKVVLQCFDNDEPADFLKVGNSITAEEMKNEIKFLSINRNYKSFKTPELLNIPDIESEFTFQATKEFLGGKAKPVLTEEIVIIYKEIASIKIDGNMEFSHGDFAPWNIKKGREKYVVFDWECCGMRIKGFDLMHFVYSIKTRLERKDDDTAFTESLIEIKKYIPEFYIDKNEFRKEYYYLHK